MTWPELVTTGDWTRLHAVGNGLDCMVIVQYLVNPTYLARTSKARRAISPAPWRYQDTKTASNSLASLPTHFFF